MKDFILYPEALELKQLGFDEPCFGVYATKDGYVRKSAYDEIGDAPTYSQAFRFFREKYGLYADIYRIGKKFNAGIEDMNIGSSKETVVEGVDYEEAELACLKKLIEIANDKQ
jgi:hypothetical protein